MPSSIPMPGLAAFLAIYATLALGALGVLLAGVAGLVSTLPPWDRREARVARFVAGPLACIGVGVAAYGLGWAGVSFDRLDPWALLLPVIGVAVGVGAALLARRTARRPRERRWAKWRGGPA